MLLHNNLAHLFWNCLALMMIGFTMEINLKEDKQAYRMLGLLVVGGVAGNMLSAVLD